MKTIIIISLLIVHCTLLIAETRYVSKTGTSTPPYITWETASDSIQKAINICNNGDTVIVANGVYKEFLIIDSAITLLGISVDSTVIDGTGLGDYNLIDVKNNLIMKRFTVIGKGMNNGTFWVGIGTINSNLNISDCKILNCNQAIFLGPSSGTVENVIVNNCQFAVETFCYADTCKPVIKNSVFILKNGKQAISFIDGGQPVIENNILMSEDNSLSEISIGISTAFDIKSSVIRNNSIVRFSLRGISMTARDTAEIINNALGYRRTNKNVGFIVNNPKYQLKNNIIYKTSIGIEQYSYTSGRDYNLYWENDKNINQGSLNEHEIEADPMFVNDTIPTASMFFDFNLQKYSPAIDAGDPNILDVDGSRSDMGIFGGPLGQKYTYRDLAPRNPQNVTAVFENGLINLKWNKNSEADLYRYRVYRDTVEHFIYDTSKIIAVTADTFYNDNTSALNAESYYYKVTAIDSSNNQSPASEEIKIIVTGLGEMPPQIVEDYKLMQNYPNPFNPSTKITYRLKELGYVKLMVYNILGEIVKVLVNEFQEKGYYEAEFTSESEYLESTKGLYPEHPTFYGDTASGIYLYRIEVTGKGNIPVYSEMKKMMLVK